MRLTSSRAYTRPTAVPKMPPGLVELMEGLARDVLKSTPTNVYEFCANHMAKLLEIRDGPSSKKALTVEQKILIAQEKVRQRAKERRERFDKEVQLQSDENTLAIDKTDSPSIQTELVFPSQRAPVHHINNLEHASEVEISHVADKIPLSETLDALLYDESTVTKEDANDVTFENVEGLQENKNAKVESVTEIILVEEQIFGKIEEETINSDILKESNKIEIISQLEVLESHLQTISEASDENPVSESIMILPEITINDDHDGRVFDENLDVINESDYKSAVKISGNDEEEILKSDGVLIETESTDLDSKATESNGIPIENDITNGEHIVSDSIKGCENIASNDKPTVQLTKNDEEQNGREPVQVLESSNILNVTSSTDIEKDANDREFKDTVQQFQNVVEITTVSVDAISTGDKANLVTPSADNNIADDENICDDAKNEQIVKDSATDDIQNIKITVTSNDDYAKINQIETDSEPGTEVKMHNEATAKDDKIDASEVNSDLMVTTPESDSTEIELNETQEKLEPSAANEDSDFEKTHDHTTDVSLLKTDSIENTNEDSSIVESDLSKTDDDSTQNNPNNMDLETAAVTIQKVFRSFMFKSRNSTFEDATNDEHNSMDEDSDKKEEYYAAAANLSKERRPLGITRMDTVLQTVNEEKSLSLSTDDSSTLSSAATTIQAHVRGFLVRNRLNSSKTFSMNSLVNSHEVLENDSDQQKSKTVLNIHIVPGDGNYLSRDESLITSMELSLDGSPPSSVNLHPLSYDISERRKMLKREDAVQSVSPPSNNSGKLSEDSVMEVLINENGVFERESTDEKINEVEEQSYLDNEASDVISSASTVTPSTIITLSKSEEPLGSPREYTEAALQRNGRSLTKMSSDESDVITPYVPSPRSSENATKLLQSGEFHDVVLPTKVSRNDTSVVRGE